MTSFDKMKESEKKIKLILDDFKTNNSFSKRSITKYYQELEVSEKKFVNNIKESMYLELSEKDVEKFREIIREF